MKTPRKGTPRQLNRLPFVLAKCPPTQPTHPSTSPSPPSLTPSFSLPPFFPPSLSFSLPPEIFSSSYFIAQNTCLRHVTSRRQRKFRTLSKRLTGDGEMGEILTRQTWRLPKRPRLLKHLLNGARIARREAVLETDTPSAQRFPYASLWVRGSTGFE